MNYRHRLDFPLTFQMAQQYPNFCMAIAFGGNPYLIQAKPTGASSLGGSTPLLLITANGRGNT